MTKQLARRKWGRSIYGDRGSLEVSLLWEPRDFWIGVYWNTRIVASRPGRFNDWTIGEWYICFIPCLPIKIRRVR